MNLIYILYLLLFIVKVICSGHNHQALQIAELVMAAADELCIEKPECGPKKDGKGFISLKIGVTISNKDGKSVYNDINASIKDIFPILRYMPDDDAEFYFKKFIFPAAKKIYEAKKLDDNSNFEKEQDLLRHIISSDFTIFSKIELINQPVYSKEVDNSETKNCNTKNINRIFIEYISNEKAELNEIPGEDLLALDSLSKEDNKLIKTIIEKCRERPLCRERYVSNLVNNPGEIKKGEIDNIIKDKCNFMIVKDDADNYKDGKQRYHFVINDLENERLACPFTIVKEGDNFDI